MKKERLPFKLLIASNRTYFNASSRTISNGITSWSPILNPAIVSQEEQMRNNVSSTPISIRFPATFYEMG